MKKKTKDIMDGVNSFLKNKYGDISPEWGCMLIVLENTLDRYFQVKQILDKVGIYDDTTKLKNPLLSTEKDCLATILKLSQKLSLSPYDLGKLKLTEDEDDSEDFIDSLTN